MDNFTVTYTKNGKTHIHTYHPKTKEEALGVGHELTRDQVADFFRVDPPKKDGKL